MVQLNLTGLIIFSAALIAASVLVTRGLVSFESAKPDPSGRAAANPTPFPDAAPVVEQKDPAPWGQLVTQDIDLEQPEEYLTFEADQNTTETWAFEGMTPAAVRSLMQSCGVAADAIDRALSLPLLSIVGSNTVVTPDMALVLSLTPATRARLYGALGRFGSNRLMQFPFCLVGQNAAGNFAGSGLGEDVTALLRKLLYPRGDGQCFSDLGVLLREIPSQPERLRVLKALSRQSAVMARLRIWPDTDVDKLLAYWCRGAQIKDLRPLLESLKRVPDGTSISLLYLLPPFARQRLYTYPEPGRAGDPAMDCHWTTMNFFNEVPDNRFSDPAYTVAFLESHYYKIGAPTAYGDRVFLLDRNGNAIHSAVYLADGLVFTKNGNNFAQPWMLMRLKDLIAEYTTDIAPPMAVYRNRDR